MYLQALIYVRQYSSDDDSSSDSNNEENTKRGQPEGDETKGNADDTMNSGENSKQKSLKEPRYYCPYDLNERDDDQNTPLHVAIHSMKLDCVKLLIDSGVSVNRRCDGSTPLVSLTYSSVKIGFFTRGKNLMCFIIYSI